MKIWGCVAHALIISHQHNKLEPKTKRFFFVGYSSNTKGYRLYASEDKIIIKSKYIKFLEERFDCEEYIGEKEELL